MNRSRPTVKHLRANRGVRQMSMIHIESRDEAAAAASAGIDLLSIEDPIWNADMRTAAGDCFVFVGLLYGHLVTTEDYLRAAHAGILAGGDAVYCAAGLSTVEALANEGIPVCGHTGLIPSKRTWTGGFRAVGKTLDTAQLVYRQVKDLENAGAFAAEIEVVPEAVATEISQRTSLVLLSMGAGAGCDAQYLFSSDMLGYTAGHAPRHARRYRDFKSELSRLQLERIGAFAEFQTEVASGEYPAETHKVPIAPDELAAFRSYLATLD